MDTPYSISNSSEYCLGRMVGKVGIVRIGTMMSLSAAEAQMKEFTKLGSGEYIIFSRNTGRVIFRLSC